MTWTFYTDPDGQVVTISSPVFFDARQLAMAILGEQVKWCAPGKSQHVDLEVSWFGTDACHSGSRQKYYRTQHDNGAWTEWERC